MKNSPLTKILGLDIGTNSIGWAVIEHDPKNHEGKILGVGSRIIPMGQDLINEFEKGNSVTKSADRRAARSARRNRQRYHLRRDRLSTALKMLNWIPEDFQPGHRLPISEKTLDELTSVLGTESIPLDWANYYLRKKALHEKVEKEGLARILFQMNNRRGFESNRKTAESDEFADTEVKEEKWPKSFIEAEVVKVKSLVQDKDEKGKPLFYRKKPQYTITLEDGRTGKALITGKPEWAGEEMELEITHTIQKNGDEQLNFAKLVESDWKKRKRALDQNLAESGKHPGEYFFDKIKVDPGFKVRQRVLDRWRYKAELQAILEKQAEFHSELKDAKTSKAIANALYTHNRDKILELETNDVIYALVNDIIYYQRPLRSQKNSIGGCQLEPPEPLRRQNGEVMVDDKGKVLEREIKVAPVSSPMFQEFRAWQNVHNLKIWQREIESTSKDGQAITLINEDVSGDFIDAEAKEKLFELFNQKEIIRQKDVLKTLGIDDKMYRWNFPEDAELMGNETKHFFRKAFKATGYEAEGEAILNDAAKLQSLWHKHYSIIEKKDLQKALLNDPLLKLPEPIAAEISRREPFKLRYGAYSSKALKKLLPLLRLGKFWDWCGIDERSKKRIAFILSGEEWLGEINDRTREKAAQLNLETEEDFQGLPIWMASYVVYGKHSERDSTKLQDADEIEFIGQHELRNPIVTQVVNETLRVIQDIWTYKEDGKLKYGRPDEIHIELARDLKKTAKERDKAYRLNQENNIGRRRAASLIRELKSGGNPQSKSDVERFLLWEEQASAEKKEEFYKEVKFRDVDRPTPQEVQRYRLWCEQGFRSPYSGCSIPIGKLFTREYDIDHIIPQRRFFDDSFSNKVVVERGANEEKGKLTAYQYILQGSRRGIDLYKPAEYLEYVKKTFGLRSRKAKLLMSEDAPEKFTERQKVDTRYIGKKLITLLSAITKENPESQAKGKEDSSVVVTSGSITNELKGCWGMHDLMKELVLWRFQRMDEIKIGKKDIEGNQYDQGKENGHHILKNYDKRVDHRHHALDALVVACTSRSHIQYLNTLNATAKDEEERKKYEYLLDSDVREELKARRFAKPWPNFWKDAHRALEGVVVSHKKTTRVLTKGVNQFTKYVKQNGEWKKQKVKQKKGDLWSARQPLSAGTNRGIVMLREKIEVSDLKKVLRDVKNVSGRHIRLQLEQALAANKGDIKKTSSYLEQHPVLEKDGSAKTSFLMQKRETSTIHTPNACWYLPHIQDESAREQLIELWEKCHRNEHLFRAWLENNPLKDAQENVISQVEVETHPRYTANRVVLDGSFNEKKIEKVCNQHLRKILLEHLETYEETDESGKTKSGPKIAFGSDGLEALAKREDCRKPVNSVRIYEPIGKKYLLNGTYVETAKGTNLFFAIYENPKTQKREFETIPLNDAIARMMNGQSVAEEKDGLVLKYVLSPNDLVYVPEAEEASESIDLNDERKIAGKIYKMVSSTKAQCFFVHQTVSSTIEDKIEFESLNKMERALDGQMVKERGIKLQVDRLGHIKRADQ